jgi:DNA-binding NarL/FixJ family response regulator
MKELNRKIYTHLIIDFELKDGIAFEILPNIRSVYPLLKIMIFSGSPAAVYQKALKKYRIHDYISKSDDKEKTLGKMKHYFSRRSKRGRVPDKESIQNPFSKLTPREIEVLYYILRGTGTNAIGNALNLKWNTVSTLKSRILEKTETKNVKELLDLALAYKII